MSGRESLDDATARRIATTSFDQNLAVIAGAGTGKTSLLVERILNAIGSGTVRIEELAAITFTQKAAGELRERLAAGLERLVQLARDSAEGHPIELDRERGADRAFPWLRDEARVEPAELRRRALAALEGLHRSTLDTIHGLCGRLLREHPIQARVDPAFEVDTGEQFEAVLDEQWEAFLVDELGAKPPREDLWRRLRDKLDLTQIGSAARELAAFSVPADLMDSPARAADARALFGDEIHELVEAIDGILDRQRGMTRANEQKFRTVAAALRTLVDEGVEAFQRHVAADPELTRRIVRKQWVTVTRALQGVDTVEMKRIGDRAFSLARDLLRADEALIRDLVEALAPFVPRAREALLRRGYVGFDGLLVLARDLLLHHPTVRDAVRRRIRMLLVDEFQDTDPLQYEIILLLAEREGGRASDPYDADLEPGRLFVVGDPKQSIYRFRGADYGAFRRAVACIEAQGGRRIHLTANYRGVPGVLRPVNRLFESEGAAWRASVHQPEYVPIHAERSGSANGPCVELWTLEGSEGLRAEERRSLEGEVVAEEILRRVESGELRYGQITLLLRAFTNLALYLRPLRARNVPFVVDGGREFLKRPEVGHLIAALRTLAQPSNEIALLAFLRSPAAGVPDDELARWAAEKRRWSYYEEPSEAEFPALARAFRLLRELRQCSIDSPADRVVRTVLERTGLLVVSAAAFEGAQRVANLRKLAAAAAELARSGRLSLLEVIDALEAERTADIESDSPLADEGMDAVRVLTVHKAKGLESEMVIVADLARQDARPAWRPFEARVAALPDGRRALGVRCGLLRNAAAVFAEEDERRHETAEELRVLYVALTRPRERLVVVGADTKVDVPWLGALAPWGYRPKEPPDDGALLAGAEVVHRRVRPARARRGEALSTPTGAPAAVEAYRRARSRLLAESRPPLMRPSEETPLIDDEPGAGAIPAVAERGAALGTARDLARAVGSAVHRALEQWDQRNPADLVELGVRTAERIAERQRLETEAVRREAREILDDFVRSPLGERLRKADVLGREVAMLHRAGTHRAWGGSIDLIYRDERGHPVIADYKTDRIEDEAELVERYREQLAIYSAAVREALALDAEPRGELWVLRTGTIVEL